MKAIPPNINAGILPPGARELVMGANQPEYQPLPATRTPMQVIMRWELSEDDRRAIAAGADVFVSLLTPGPMNPIMINVGPWDFRQTEGV